MRVENMFEPRKPRDYKDQFFEYVVGLLIPWYGFINVHTKIINTIALHKRVVSNMHIQVIVINVPHEYLRHIVVCCVSVLTWCFRYNIPTYHQHTSYTLLSEHADLYRLRKWGITKGQAQTLIVLEIVLFPDSVLWYETICSLSLRYDLNHFIFSLCNPWYSIFFKTIEWFVKTFFYVKWAHGC